MIMMLSKMILNFMSGYNMHDFLSTPDVWCWIIVSTIVVCLGQDTVAYLSSLSFRRESELSAWSLSLIKLNNPPFFEDTP